MDQVESKRSMLLMFMVLLVAIISVIGISFAVYNIVVDDTKVGNILTGKFTVDYENYDGYCTDFNYVDYDSCTNNGFIWNKAARTLNIGNGYPVSDEVGAKGTDSNSVMSFGVSSSDVDIFYTIGFTGLEFGDNLNLEHIKINVMKNGQYILGSDNTGVLLSQLERDIDNDLIICSSSAVKDEKDIYVLKAWIDKSYKPEIVEEVLNEKHVFSMKEEQVSFRLKIKAEMK